MNQAATEPIRIFLVALLPWLAAWQLTRHRHWSATPWLGRCLAMQSAVVSIILTAQPSGALGLLHITQPWLAPLVYVLATRRFGLRSADFKTEPPADSANCHRFITGFTLGLVLLQFGRLAGPSIAGAVKVVSDAPIYHLYFAAKWWLAGRIYFIPIPFGESAAPYFPANGDLWFMTLVGWTGNLNLAKIGQVPFWFFAGWALFHLCRRLGTSSTSSLIAAAFWMTLTPLALFTFEANVDTIFAAWFILSVLFFVDYDLRRIETASGKPSENPCILQVQALLAAGLAWGTKAPGLVFIPPWLLIVSVRLWQTSSRTGLRSKCWMLCKIWLIAIVPVAFWWARNAIATGNPLYPLPVEFAGITLFEGWYGPGVMKQSPYYIPFQNWQAFVDQLLAVVDPRVLPLFCFAVIAFLWSFRKNRTPENRWVFTLLLFGLATIAIYWCLVPYRTQQRFFLHGLALFAPVMAIAMDRFKFFQILSLIALALHATTPQGWPVTTPGQEPFWDFSPLVPNRMPSLSPIFEIVVKSALGDIKSISLIAFATFGVAWWAMQPRRIAIISAIACGLAFVMIVAAEYPPIAKTSRGIDYPVFPDYERAWAAFDAVTEAQPRRVAYTGTNLAIYLMGPELQNSVEYVNIDTHTDWLPHHYHLSQPPGQRRWPDPRPTWERMAPNYNAWLANLNAKQIDLVVVARANPNEGRSNPYDSIGFPIERSWMANHPEQFTPVYGVRENDPEMRIYELKR